MLCDVSVSTSSRAGEREVTIQVVGELDLATIPEFRSAARRVAAADYDNVQVDLRACEFIDSAALGVLLGLARRVGPGRLAVLAAGPVAQIITLTGVAELVGLVDDSASHGTGRA